MILLCRLFDKGRKGIFVRISFDRRRQSVAGDLHKIQLRVFFLKICLVCMRRDRRRRRKNSEALRVLGRLYLHAHLDDRDIFFKKSRRHIEGDRIARDQDHLHLMLLQKILDGKGESHNVIPAAFAIGISHRISEKYDAFFRVRLMQHAGYRKTSDARVHDADRSVIHYILSPSESFTRPSIFSFGRRAIRPVFIWVYVLTVCPVVKSSPVDSRTTS